MKSSTVCIILLLSCSFAKQPMPKLLWIEFYSKTGNDNKDHDTGIYITVTKATGELISNIDKADNSATDATEYNDHSYHYLKLPLLGTDVTKQDCQNSKIKLRSLAYGNDNWNIETAKIIYYFSDGTLDDTKGKTSFSLNSRSSQFAEVNF